MISQANIKDGTGRTYLFGEKFVDRRYYNGGYPSDKVSMYTGMGSDNYRGTYAAWTSSSSPSSPTDKTKPVMMNDTIDPNDLDHLSTWNYQCLFGSAHNGFVNFAFCDGSTKSISVSIDPLTHRSLGERDDRQIIDESVLSN